MLQARSVAIVGASARPGSFGQRMVTRGCPQLGAAVACTWSTRATPRSTGGPACPACATLAEPVDLVLLGVPDGALEAQLDHGRRARRPLGRDLRQVVVGPSRADRQPPGAALTRRTAWPGSPARPAWRVRRRLHGVRQRRPRPAGDRLRRGRTELPAGPVAVVSHCGSAFSALLRSHRRLGLHPGRVVRPGAGHDGRALPGLRARPARDAASSRCCSRRMRSPELLRAGLARAAAADVPVVALTVGTSGPGAAMVAAHSGALAGADGAWEALFDAYGVLRVRDLDELADTLELFAAGRRATVRAAGHRHGARLRCRAGDGRRPGRRAGRAVRAAGAGDPRPAGRPARPGPGADQPARRLGHRRRHPPAVRRLPARDGRRPGRRRRSPWPSTSSRVRRRRVVSPCRSKTFGTSTDLPVAVLSTMHSALDQAQAQRLRGTGVPVLEGARSGLVALRHLTSYGDRPSVCRRAPRSTRPGRQRWLRRADASSGPLDGAAVSAAGRLRRSRPCRSRAAATRADAVAAAERLGWPVVLKTDEPGIDHKSDVGGVVLGLASAEDVAAAYDRLPTSSGRGCWSAATPPAGVELALGLVRDPLLGPLVLVASGGVLVELVDDRAVALPPVSTATAARRALGRLRVDRLLDGFRGGPPVDRQRSGRRDGRPVPARVELGDSARSPRHQPDDRQPGRPARRRHPGRAPPALTRARADSSHRREGRLPKATSNEPRESPEESAGLPKSDVKRACESRRREAGALQTQTG